jgi:hypothetical protein
MANLDFSMFGNEQLSLSDMQDRLIGLQRQMNWGLRNLDSINVKRINTEITVIKSEGGEMDLTGRQLRMYDETSRLRFRVGLSTSDVYDLTMWSSNAATTDYNASSNASVYVNSSGEVTFADRIRTKKDAEVGTIITIGTDTNYSTGYYSHGIAIRSAQVGTSQFDALIRVINSTALTAGQTALEFMLKSSTDPFDTMIQQEFDFITNFTHTWIQYGQLHQLRNFTTAAATVQIRTTDSNAIFEGYTTHLTFFQSQGDLLLNPVGKAFKYTTASSNEIATVGMLGTSAGLTSDQAMTNFSSDRRLSMDFTTGGAVKLYQNSSLACSLAQCVNSTRVIQLDFTTALDNFLIYRNSTKIAGAVLAQSSNAYKLSWDSVNGILQFYENGINQANFIDRAKVVTNVSTDRQVDFDFTTALNNLTVSRNSTIIDSVVLANSTNALKLDWSTVTGLPTLILNSTIAAFFARSAGVPHRFSWSTVDNWLNLQYNSTTVANFIDKDQCMQNVSTDRKLSMDFTTGGAAKLFQNSSLACSLVQGIHSTRVINLDYTTDHDNFNVYQNGVLQGSVIMHNSSNGLMVQTTAMGSGQMLRIIKQSSQITQPLMDYTTGLNVQMHIRRLTSTEKFFPSTGVWVIWYSSGTYMGKTLLSV